MTHFVQFRLIFRLPKVVPWLRRLAVGLLTGETRVHNGSNCGQHWEWIFFEYLYFPLSVSFHQCYVLVFLLILLSSEGQTDETWEPSNKATQWTEKYFSIVFQRSKIFSGGTLSPGRLIWRGSWLPMETLLKG